MIVVLMVALNLLPGVASVISLPANYLQAAIYALFLRGCLKPVHSAEFCGPCGRSRCRSSLPA